MHEKGYAKTFYEPPGSYDFELGSPALLLQSSGKGILFPWLGSFGSLPIKFSHINIAAHVGLWREIIISKEYKVCENAQAGTV